MKSPGHLLQQSCQLTTWIAWNMYLLSTWMKWKLTLPHSLNCMKDHNYCICFCCFRARCSSLWTTCLRGSSAQPTVGQRCPWPSSTCLTSLMTKLCCTTSRIQRSCTPGSPIGKEETEEEKQVISCSVCFVHVVVVVCVFVCHPDITALVDWA